MSNYFFSLEVLHDGEPIGGPVGLETPLQLGVEALRWHCVCRGVGNFDPGHFDIVPAWHKDGDPFVEAIEFATADRAAVVTLDARRLYADEARKTSARLVQEEQLKEGALYDFRIRAQQRGSGAPPRLDLLHYEVRNGGERPLIATASDPEHVDPSDCFDVLVDPAVLLDADRLSREAGTNETGGLLGGYLRRGSGPARTPYLHVTVVVPAGGDLGARASFRFTPEAWNRGRAALADRGADEIMCGWFHSHPPDLCPPTCPPEKRKTCALRHPFLSGDDLLVHRSAFPAPFNIALLLSDDGEERHVPSVWGWRNGAILRRAYHLTKQAS